MVRFEAVQGSVLASRYRLERPLDEGGMATVWQAHDLQRDMPVALKLLRGARSELLTQRLQREAQAAARVEHPAIVRVLDANVTDYGAPFLVMELLSGETLADLLARGGISSVWAVQLLLPIMDGLGAAHAQGVVHRDLKPSNVFLDMRGHSLQPRLVDFGIATLAKGAPRLTDNGVTIGSPSYMSPEQARGEDVDFRSDIWSMCVLLYKAISGSVPFRGVDAHAILRAIVREEPPPLPLGAVVDEYLSRIIMSGLRKDPLARPASMRELGQQLAQWLLLHGVSVDACGAPLVPKWFAEDAPGPAAEVTGAITRRITKVTPIARFLSPRRRWVLWAAASLLVAGASLAFSKSSEHPSAALPQRTPELADSASIRPSALQADAMLQPDALPAADTAAQPAAEILPDRALERDRGVEPTRAAPSTTQKPRPSAAPAPRRRALPF